MKPALRIVQGGDYIRAVNGQEIMEKEELIEAVNDCGGEEVVLDLERDGEKIQVKLNAVQTEENEYKLGIWVRDNTQGIGTLDFLTEGGSFGALGHGINDVDTGTLLQPSEGKLYDTTIINIHKGEAGTPGETVGADSIPEQLYLRNHCGEYGSRNLRQRQQPAHRQPGNGNAAGRL